MSQVPVPGGSAGMGLPTSGSGTGRYACLHVTLYRFVFLYRYAHMHKREDTIVLLATRLSSRKHVRGNTLVVNVCIYAFSSTNCAGALVIPIVIGTKHYFVDFTVCIILLLI